MKKILFVAIMLVSTTLANAMSYREAQREALFLADKMAYELGLNNRQYEAAYEANLDYLMGLSDRSQVFGNYWARRNTVLQIILSPHQYSRFEASLHFYRPVYWQDNSWRWRIYNRYARSRYYNTRPECYTVYRGGRHIDYYRNRCWIERPRRVIVEGAPREWRHDRSYRRYEKGPKHHHRGKYDHRESYDYGPYGYDRGHGHRPNGRWYRERFER